MQKHYCFVDAWNLFDMSDGWGSLKATETKLGIFVRPKKVEININVLHGGETVNIYWTDAAALCCRPRGKYHIKEEAEMVHVCPSNMSRKPE